MAIEFTTEADWDKAQDESGVVHDEIGDHIGSASVEMGYDIGSITKGIVAYYPLDDSSTSSTAIDETTLDNDGTINGATYNGSGNVGSDSLAFNGDNVIAPGEDFEQPTVSISIFVRWSGGSDQIWVSKVDSVNPSYGWQISGHNGDIRVRWVTTQNDFQQTYLENISGDGLWHHVAAVLDGDELRVYTDGGLIGSKTYTGDIIYDGNDLRLGQSGDGSFSYNGDLDDVRIFGRALSQPEIEALSNRTQTSTVTAEDTI